MAVSSIGDTYFTNYSTEANDAVSQKMTSQIQDAETDEEMLDACKQFESYLVQQMFKWKNLQKYFRMMTRITAMTTLICFRTIIYLPSLTRW